MTTNRLTPDQISSIVGDVVKNSNWTPKRGDELAARFREVHERVTARASNEFNTFVPSFAVGLSKTHGMVLDDLVNNRFTYDELMHGVAAYIAEKIIKQIL